MRFFSQLSLAPKPVVLAFTLAAFAVCGCTVPVAAGLDESDANRIVVSLDHANVDATKESDPAADGRFRVVVQRDDASRALVTMQTEGLPRPKLAGVLSAIDRGALVPSREAEHAQWVAGLSGDLAQTLEGIDGILSARVHLNVPDLDPLREGQSARATASLLIEHRGPTAPIALSEVQRLVAGAVPSLAASDVVVVMLPRGAAGAASSIGGNGSDAASSSLARVGPISVARSSMRTLQATLAGLLALLALLAGATLVLYSRLVRLARLAPVHARATGAGKPA